MKNILLVCASPYQIFVATWLKMWMFQTDAVDIIVSDIIGGEKITENMRTTGLFEQIYFVKTELPAKTKHERLLLMGRPLKQLEEYIHLEKKYDVIGTSTWNLLPCTLIQVIKFSHVHGISNPRLKIMLFEDGTSTYSKWMEKKYNACGEHNRLTNYYKPPRMRGQLSGVYVFNKELMLWKPDAPVIEMPKIPLDDARFKNTVNMIFDYDSMQDVYDCKYIFMEESFNHDGFPVNDIELIERLAKHVGKENIMIKIHPRNTENRFKKLGYKTNENTSIPWELIVFNQNMEDKVLITIASTSILNTFRIFGQKVQAYSLYKCIDRVPEILAGDLWDLTKFAFEKYSPYITILKSPNELDFI